MKVMIIIGAVLGVYAVSVLGVATLHLKYTNTASERYARAIELGEKEAPLPDPGAPLLIDACRGKLIAGGPRSIAAYVAKMAELPALEKTYYHVDRTLLGVYNVVELDFTDRFFEDLTVSPETFSWSLTETLNPVDWSNRLSRAKKGAPEMAETRYLVVARYASLTNPIVADKGFVPGSGDFGAKVLSFPGGEVICSGRGSVRMPYGVSATSGAGDAGALANARDLVPLVFVQAAVATPLADVCDAGGPELCKLTGRDTGERPGAR